LTAGTPPYARIVEDQLKAWDALGEAAERRAVAEIRSLFQETQEENHRLAASGSAGTVEARSPMRSKREPRYEVINRGTSSNKDHRETTQDALQAITPQTAAFFFPTPFEMRQLLAIRPTAAAHVYAVLGDRLEQLQPTGSAEAAPAEDAPGDVVVRGIIGIFAGKAQAPKM
jgi:hypothetical protein